MDNFLFSQGVCDYVSYLLLTLTNVTEVASLHVASRASRYIIKDQIWNDLYHRHLYQFKTGVRFPLASSANDLEEIYTFGIKNWLNCKPG